MSSAAPSPKGAPIGPRAVSQPGINWAPIFGYDVFISYNRADAHAYARQLEAELRLLDLRCFLDNTDAPPGVALDSTLKTALRRTRTLVLLASNGALRSHWVREEVQTFAKTGRDIVPINLDGAVTAVDPENPILAVLRKRDAIWIDDVAAGAIPTAPAPATVEGVRRTFGYRRANKLRRLATTTAFLILLAITIVAVWQWRTTRVQFVRLSARQLLIEAETLRRERPADIHKAALLAMESQMRAPGAEAVTMMRQTLQTLGGKPLHSIPLSSTSTTWRISPAGDWALVADGKQLLRIKLPSGEIERTIAIDETGPPDTDTDPRGSFVEADGMGRAVAFSSDGSTAAVWNQRKELVLYDLGSGKALWRQPYAPLVHSLSVANRGAAVAVRSRHTVGAGQFVGTDLFVCSPAGCSQRQLPDDLSNSEANWIDPEGGRLLSMIVRVQRPCCGFTLFETPLAQLQSAKDVYLASGGPAAHMTIAGDNRTSATLSAGKLYLRQSGDFTELPRATNSTAVILSRSARAMATTAPDGVRVWDVRGALAAGRANADGDEISSTEPISFLAQAVGETLLSVREGLDLTASCTLLTASHDVTTVWNCATGQPVLRAPHLSPIRAGMLLPDGESFVTLTEKSLEIRGIHPLQIELDHQGASIGIYNPEEAVQASPDGTRALVCSTNAVWIWDLLTGRLVLKLSQEPVMGIFTSCSAAGNAGSVIATLQSEARPNSEDLAVIRMLGASARPSFDKVIDDRMGSVNTWRTSPTLPLLFMSAVEGKITAFDLTKRELPNPGLEQHLDLLAISGDGALVASFADGLQVWRAGYPLSSPLYKRNPGPVKELVFSPGHTRLGIQQNDRTIAVWDAEQGKPIVTIKVAADIAAYEFDPAGKALGVRAGDKVILYSAQTGKELATLAAGPLPQEDEKTPRPLLGRFGADLYAGYDGNTLVGIDLDSGATKWKRPLTRVRPYAVMGKLLAITREDNTVALIEPVSGEVLATAGGLREVEGIRAIGSDRLLIWGGSRMQRYEWQPDPCAALVARLPGPLSREDWDHYLSGQSYRDTLSAWGASSSWWRRLWP